MKQRRNNRRSFKCRKNAIDIFDIFNISNISNIFVARSSRSLETAICGTIHRRP
jgi:hypothetical protein